MHTPPNVSISESFVIIPENFFNFNPSLQIKQEFISSLVHFIQPVVLVRQILGSVNVSLFNYTISNENINKENFFKNFIFFFFCICFCGKILCENNEFFYFLKKKIAYLLDLLTN